MLKEEIIQNLNVSLKSGQKDKISVLRQLLAAILNKEKEKRFKNKEEKDARLTDQEVMEVISSEAKKRRESILEFEKGKREDLAEKEKKELEILKDYLPEQLPEQEVRKIIEKAIKKSGAKELKDMGKVMAELMPEIKGKADGALVSGIVKEMLSL